jgi:hypothetical protein
MLDVIRRNMAAGMDGFDPVALMKPWLPPDLQSMETLQKLFWQALQPRDSEHWANKTGK